MAFAVRSQLPKQADDRRTLVGPGLQQPIPQVLLHVPMVTNHLVTVKMGEPG